MVYELKSQRTRQVSWPLGSPVRSVSKFNYLKGAVVVAQLPEVRGSNSAISKILYRKYLLLTVEETKIKKK